MFCEDWIINIIEVAYRYYNEDGKLEDEGKFEMCASYSEYGYYGGIKRLIEKKIGKTAKYMRQIEFSCLIKERV